MKSVLLLFLVLVANVGGETIPATQPDRPKLTRIPQPRTTLQRQFLDTGDTVLVSINRYRGQSHILGTTRIMTCELRGLELNNEVKELQGWLKIGQGVVLQPGTELRIIEPDPDENVVRTRWAKVVVLDGPHKGFVGVDDYTTLELVDIERYRKVRRHQSRDAGDLVMPTDTPLNDLHCYLARSAEDYVRLANADDAGVTELLKSKAVIKIRPHVVCEVLKAGVQTDGSEESFAEVQVLAESPWNAGERGFIAYRDLELHTKKKDRKSPA